jgi:hypothetical protein
MRKGVKPSDVLLHESMVESAEPAGGQEIRYAHSSQGE